MLLSDPPDVTPHLTLGAASPWLWVGWYRELFGIQDHCFISLEAPSKAPK